jgi:hypothetical protein
MIIGLLLSWGSVRSLSATTYIPGERKSSFGLFARTQFNTIHKYHTSNAVHFHSSRFVPVTSRRTVNYIRERETETVQHLEKQGQRQAIFPSSGNSQALLINRSLKNTVHLLLWVGGNKPASDDSILC